MHYFSFHIGDYAAHTRHLSLIEDLAYRRLLDLYYMTEKPIIADTAARLIGMREHGDDVLCVLVEFFEATEEGYINKRADNEIASFRAMSEGGKKGANKRWNKGGNGDAIATLSPSYDTLNQPPIATVNHEPVTNISTNVDIKDRRAPRFDAQAHLVDIGVPPLIAGDWITLRKSKKAPVTQTAISRIEQEAHKAGVSIAEAMATCCQRGWAGFKAEWLDEKRTNGHSYLQAKQESDSITNKALGLDKIAIAIKARQAFSGMLIEGDTP
jgi:uncharacterized protein YdaU (DUF1376 family)